MQKWIEQRGESKQRNKLETPERDKYNIVKIGQSKSTEMRSRDGIFRYDIDNTDRTSNMVQ